MQADYPSVAKPCTYQSSGNGGRRPKAVKGRCAARTEEASPLWL
jgi:hypothetical protein